MLLVTRVVFKFVYVADITSPVATVDAVAVIIMFAVCAVFFYRSLVVAKKSIGTVEGKLNISRAAQVNGTEENAACKIKY